MFCLSKMGFPETYEFFLNESKDGRSYLALCGLWRSGGVGKALPIMLEMLKEMRNTGSHSPLVEALIAWDHKDVIAAVAEMAREGNVGATFVLMNSKQAQAKDVIFDLAKKELAEKGHRTSRLPILLTGIAKRWPVDGHQFLSQVIKETSETETMLRQKKKSIFDIPEPDKSLLYALPDITIGIREAGSAHFIPELTELAAFENPHVQSDSIRALVSLTPGPHTPKYKDAILGLLEYYPDRIGSDAVDDLVQTLIDDNWRDSTQENISKIVNGMERSHNYCPFYFMRLLRHLTNNAMGPETLEEFVACCKMSRCRAPSGTGSARRTYRAALPPTQPLNPRGPALSC